MNSASFACVYEERRGSKQMLGIFSFKLKTVDDPEIFDCLGLVKPLVQFFLSVCLIVNALKCICFHNNENGRRRLPS